MANIAMWKYTDAATAQPISYASPEIDFGIPYYKKKAYKVVLNYKLDTATALFQYRIDGATSWTTASRYLINGVLTSSLSAVSNYTTCEVLLNNSNHLKCNTFQFRFYTVGSLSNRALYLNNVDVIYRPMQKDSDA